MVELGKPDANSTAILVGDRGRGSLHATIRQLLIRKKRVVVVDLSAFEETSRNIKPIEWQMIATVGRRLLGVQAGQLIAIANRMRTREGNHKISVVAVRPRPV